MVGAAGIFLEAYPGWAHAHRLFFLRSVIGYSRWKCKRSALSVFLLVSKRTTFANFLQITKGQPVFLQPVQRLQ
jgi:hypothetical protein